jgi:fructose-1,6-bisphosphatase I
MPTTLEDHLGATADPALAATLEAIAGAAVELAARIAAGCALGAAAGVNADGDAQKALDVIADESFAAALSRAPVRWLASEERETVTALDAGAPLAVAIDPLDGSGNIDINVSIGSIFGVRRARSSGPATFLAPGREQVAAGYVVYGPQTGLVLTTGAGVQAFRLDPASGRWVMTSDRLETPRGAAEFAINVSNTRHWPAPVRSFVEDCLAGAPGPLGADFNMRWIAALVVEAHRILSRGGVYLYPADARPSYARGRLRLVYECAPIAMLMEQSGGLATDGTRAILDLTPESLHARVPLVFGSADLVARIAAYHAAPPRERSPLFGDRGLFDNRVEARSAS